MAATPSPAILLSDAGGAFTAPGASGCVVGAGDALQVKLANAAGTNNWQLTCFGTDDLSSAPAITITGTGNSLRNFTAGGLGTAFGFQSSVQDNASPPNTYYDTFGVFVLTAGGQPVMFTDERYEGSAQYGWISKINTFIRGGASTPPWQMNGTLTATPGSALTRALYQVQPVAPASTMTLPIPTSPQVGDLIEIPDWTAAVTPTTGIYQYAVTIDAGAGGNVIRNPHTLATARTYALGAASQDRGGSKFFGRWSGTFWDAWIVGGT